MRYSPVCFLLFLSAASLSFSQGFPDIGQWVTGPLGNRHDLVPDAMTSAQLAIVGAMTPLTNQATVYLGCKGVDAVRPVLELRFLVPQLRGINPAAISNSATLAIGDDKFPASLDSFPVQNMTMFIVNPNPAAAKEIASLKLNQRANLYLYFQTGGRNAFFVTTLMDPSGPVSTVLTACGVAIPAAPPVPTNAATPAMKKYTFQGIHLGMSAQEAVAVEKAIATTPIKPSPGGGVDFETPQVLLHRRDSRR